MGALVVLLGLLGGLLSYLEADILLNVDELLFCRVIDTLSRSPLLRSSHRREWIFLGVDFLGSLHLQLDLA